MQPSPAPGAEVGSTPTPPPTPPRRQAPFPLPWGDGPMQRDDKIILGGMITAGAYALALLPLIPLLGSSHPALLELIRGSTASIVNMGARAKIGETSFLLAVVLGVPTIMMFDWAFWWAGKRWGDRVFIWMLGGETPRAKRRLARLHWAERRFGPLSVVLASILPVPSGLIYAAVGDGGMRLWVFLILDTLGTLLWTFLLALLGYQLGRDAVDVVNSINHYALWVSLGLVVLVVLISAGKARRQANFG